MLVLQGVKRAVESLAFHPDGNHLVTAGGYSDSIEYWSATAQTKIHEWTGPYGARQVRFHPTGRCFFCTYATSSPRSDHDFVAIDVESWESVSVKSPTQPTYLAVAPVGDRIVVHDYGYHGRLVCRKLTGAGVGRQLWAKYLETHNRTQEWIVGGLDFFPIGDRFASVEFQHRDNSNSKQEAVLRTRSAENGRILDEIACSCEMGFDVCVSPDGAWIAFHSLTALHFIPATDLRSQVTLRNPNRKHVTALAFHSSGRYLAVTSNDRTVRLHDRDAGWMVSQTYDWNIGKLKSVAFNADGTLAAAGGEKGMVAVWDMDL